MKKIILLLALFAIIICSSPAGDASVDSFDNIIQESMASSYAYYRSCDYITGEIIEKYDTLLSGNNSIDYLALATSLSESKSDRIAAMNMIVQIYHDVSEQERLYLKSYIFNYAPYVDDSTIQDFYETISSTQQTRLTYNRSTAAAYARNHYAVGTFNSNYPDLSLIGGDCANFVSQCMYAGGREMTDRWSIYQRNSTYMKPANVDQLNYSWVLTDPSPWISAGAFNSYWSNNSYTYTYSVSDYELNHDTIFWEDIFIGDPVQLMNKVYWWYEAFHTMIIVGYDDDNHDFKYAGHTNSVFDASILARICSNSAYDDCYIRFFSMG